MICFPKALADLYLTGRENMKKLYGVIFFSFLLLFMWSGNAWCHAFPDHSEPGAGAIVSATPSVRIWFSCALEPAFSSLKVLGADGKKVDKGDSHVNKSDATLLEVNLPTLSPGTYRVIWNVVSRDGHRTEGDFSFTVK